jgi:hypothetical protein
MTSRGSLTEPLPPDAQRSLWRVANVLLAVAWVLAIGVSILALATGGNPAGVLFIIGIPLFFTLVGVLFRRPPLIHR